MWRKLGLWAAPSAVAILVVGCGSFVADIHRQEAAQRSQRAHEAERLGLQATVEREQGKAFAALVSAKVADDAQVVALTASNDSLKAENDNLKAQLGAGAGLGGGVSPAPAPPGVNRFPYGQCTWYVASRRYVPWMGNAITWLSGALLYHFATGSTPRVGAIMVTAESWWGHVAYVEAINSSGSFVVSEMNFAAWGLVDSRTIVPGRVPILGFIY